MSPFIEQLGWVLIHSLWQLALLAAAAFVVQRAMRRTSAAARYAALLALLVLVVAAPLITWSLLPTQAAIPVAELPDPGPARASEPAPKLEPVAPALAPAPVTVESTPPITAVTPVPLDPVVPAKAPEPLKPSWSQWAQQSITPWLSTIVWGWSLGVLAFAIRPLWSWFTVRQLRTQGVLPVPETVQAALAQTARRLGITQAVRVLQSTIVQVPIVAGYLKPVILLPASIVTGLPASQLEAILAHELAHIRRHDYLANLIQTLVETVFFYHPAVWWLSHQIRCERENCCDDIAVAMLGNRLDYSRALLAVEELRGTPTTLAVGASGGSLLGRVRRLFHRDVDQFRLSNGSITLCGLIGIGLIALATVASTNHDGSSELFIPGAKAEIDGFGTIEVLGLRFVDSEWWSPDGSNLSASVDLGDPIRHLFNDDPLNGRQIGIVTRFSGVDSPRASRVHLHTSRAGGHHGSWSSMDRRTAEQSRITDIRFCSTNLSPDAVSGELTVLLSFDAWSPWYTIDRKSPEASQNEGPLAPLVGRTPSSLASTECEIGLQFKSGEHEEIHFEQVALDASGIEIPSRGRVGNNHLGLGYYAVPESQVAKLRYRFQRFTHEVRFRDISLKAGHQTEPEARVQVLHRPERPAEFSESVTSLASWPQLGGSAAHNPISPVTNLPTQFDLDRQENIRWSQPIGDFAFSSPVVSGGKVLIGTNNAIGRDPRFPASIDRACLQCFDERTGEFLWQYSSPKMEQGRRHDWPAIGICSTPVIEGDRVWFATNRCEIVCLDLNGHRDNEDDGEPEVSAPGDTGASNTLTPSPSPGGRGEPEMQRADVVWKYDMFNTLGVRPLNATCVTPVIAGDLLLLNSGNDVDESYQTVPAPEAPAFLAFHKATGQLIWSDKTPNPNILGNGCSMGAPAVAKIDGVWQAIFAGYDGWLYAFDLESIQRSETWLLWKFDLNPKESQYRLNGPRNEFSYRGLPSTPVVVGNHVYSAVGHNPERGEGLGRLWCIDATKRGDLSSDLVYNKSAPDVVIPHKRVQACEPDKGDFTRPNPNSGVEWVYTTNDLNKNGQIEFEEQMHLSNSLLAIHDGLLLTTDLSGLVHCLDVTTGELLWTHDQLATCWSGPLLADGKAWVIDEDGDLSIFAISRQKQLLAEIAMNSPGYTNLAAANQTLYVATKTQLAAIGSGEFPQPNGVTAKLPGGVEIELVGITPNAAPTSEGWRADGTPLESVGDWPRGATFSKDGDRFTITTDRTSKLSPDPLARDLLFEGRGLRSHPAWVILNQRGLTQFESVNADETIRRRLSYLPKESGQPLTVEMALTDSPWGPWQQIDKSGKRINTIKTFEPDQKLYEAIKFLRFGPALEGNAQRPLELVLEEPATHDDYQSGVFDITVRFIGTDQKVWTTYAQPKPLKDGRRQVVWRTGGDVPLEKIDHVEFRLRPYRHFITFKNVSLDRTPGAQVAAEHRSLPLPPTQAPDPRFTAKVPGGIEIELLRIVRNDRPEEQAWTPDGMPSPGHLDWPQRSHYKVQPDGNGYSSSDEGPGSDRAWDFAYEVRSAGSKPFVSVDVVGEGSTSSSQFLPAIGPRLVTVLPKVPESLTAFQLRVGTEAWGEWIQVGADGEILNPEAMSKSPNSPEKLVTVAGAGLDAENLDRSWIKWLALPNGGEYYQMEVRAIDDDGKIVESRSTSTGPRETTKSFELPLDRLARFEYRLRPYRHLVRFDQICTDPKKPTELKVTVDPIVYPEEIVGQAISKAPPIQASPVVAKLPGGLEVELVGVTKNVAPAKEGWKPDGSPIGEVPDWKAGTVISRNGDSTTIGGKGPPHPDARDLLVEMRGLRLQPTFDLLDLQTAKGWGQIPHADPYRNRLSLLLNKPSDTLTFRMAISDAPWGPYQQVGLDGKLLNELDLAEPEAGHYGEIRVVRCGPHPDDPSQSELILEMPEKFQERYSFSFGSIDTEGKEMHCFSDIEYNNSGKVTAKYRTDSRIPGKIARWEYRLRPYRHFITFENVSFEPGKKTEPKVSVESIEVAKTEEEPFTKSPTPEAQQPRIDLIGLTYDSVPKKETWNTNGQPLPAPEWVQQLPKLYGDAKSKPAPLYLFEVHGLRAKPSFRHRYRTAVVSGDDEVPEGRPYRMAVLYEDLKPEERNQFIIWGEHPAMRITDEPWGPWRTITKEGQFAEPVDPNTLYREGYDMVTLHGFRPLTKKPNDPELAPDEVRTGLVLKHPMDYDALYAIEIEAVPSMAGPQLVNVFTSRPVQRFRNEAKDRWDVESEWPVDPTKIDHLRYRIRPYRHRFEFQEVAYKQYERPATSAPFKVIHTKLEHDLPKPVAASRVQSTLPGGLELELLGVTPFREPGKESWEPNGKKFEPAPDWTSGFKLEPLPDGGMSDWGNEDYRDFIVRARGFSPEQLALLPFAERFESRDSTIGRMQVLTWNQQVQRLRIGIPGEWGPYRVLTADPKVPPKALAVNPPGEVPAPYRKVYDSIQLKLEASDARLDRWQSVEMKSLAPDFTPGDPDPDFEPGSRVRLVWKGSPTNPDLKYATHEAVVIDLEGKPHGSTATSAFIEPEGGHQWDVDIFDVPIGQVSHIEYRLRPYQHVVTFNNVALHPGVACGPNVVVESPLDVSAKPPAPLEFRVVASAAKKEPVEFVGQKWFLIAGEAGKPVADKSALGLPVERLNASHEYMGLVGDTPATSMPWDGTWHVEKCEIQPDPNGEKRFMISVTLDASGEKVLRTLTTNALRQRLAVIVEDRILVAPIVQEAIGTTFVITGNFTKEQAEQFAKSVRHGMAQAASQMERKPDDQPTVPQPVELQVVDAESGQAVTGAEVTVRQAISSWQPKAAQAKPNLSNGVPESRSTLQTNATGHFSFTFPLEMRVWLSDLQISIRHPDYVIEQSFGAFQVTPEMAANPELLKEKRYPNGLIKLNRGHEISGQILGPDGKPAAGVKLYAAWQMPQYLDMLPHAVTDDQGRYKFRTVKETESDLIFVIPQDAVAVSFPLKKKYGEHPPITLERGTVITGQVLGQDGKPLAGAVVQANGSDSVYDGFPKPMVRILTDSEGRYRLPPQKLPVDVRVSSLGWMGGWQPRGRDLTIDEVFLPVLVRDERREGREESQTGKTPGADASGSGALTLDFRPCETVTLTAQVCDEKGQPATDCELAVFGTAPDSQRAGDKLRSTWRGRFHAVPDQPGMFRVMAPQGLVNATLVDPEIPTGPRKKWTREVRAGERLDGPRADSGWVVLERDDHSIVVGVPSP